MLTTAQVGAFAAACVVLIAVPGPSVVFIVGRAVALGRRAALLTALGNAGGTYTLGLAVALGAGPLFERFPATLIVVKLVGAAVLCWLGVQAIRHRGDLDVAPAALPALRRRAGALALRQGYLVGLTNPKALVVFAVIMPPFLTTSTGPLAVQMALLALVPVTIGLLTDSAWAAASGTARGWLASSPRRRRALGVTGGTAMIGLGLHTAMR